MGKRKLDPFFTFLITILGVFDYQFDTKRGAFASNLIVAYSVSFPPPSFLGVGCFLPARRQAGWIPACRQAGSLFGRA
jgi:hypothetical protein